MDVFLYSSKGNESGIKVRNTISTIVSSEKLQLIHNIEDLISAFRRPHCISPIIILHLSTDNDIAALIDFRHLWEDLFLIVITDEYDEKTVSNCYQLFPRLLIHSAGSLQDVVEVLRKKKICLMNDET